MCSCIGLLNHAIVGLHIVIQTHKSDSIHVHKDKRESQFKIRERTLMFGDILFFFIYKKKYNFCRYCFRCVSLNYT